MAPVALILLLPLLLFAKEPLLAGSAGFDEGTGVAGSSPFSLRIKESRGWCAEAGGYTWYDLGVVNSATRLATAFAGVSHEGERFGWGVTGARLNGFDLFSSTRLTVPLTITLRRFRLGAEPTMLIDAIADAHAVSGGGTLSGVATVRAISIGTELTRLPRAGGESAIWEPSVSVRATSPHFGEQGAVLRWRAPHSARPILSLVERFPLGDHLALMAAFRSSPMLFSLSGLVVIGSVRGGVLAMRHPVLGWSRGVTLRGQIN